MSKTTQNPPPAAEWVEIDSLTPWDKNPRRNAAAVSEVAKSIQRFGFASPIIARQADRVVIAGHTRLLAARSLGLDKVLVRFLDLDPAQARALALADNKLGELAEWDAGLLADVLRELEAESVDLDGLGFSGEELDELLKGAGEPGEGLGDDNPYTKTVKAPIYTPKGDKPPTSDLYDQSKTAQLVEEIDRQQLPPDVRAFLLAAAQRHTVFKYARIAEFYCHASPEIQDLMERSALVVIDFNKAIECGFVHLSERLGLLADQDSEGHDAA
jgi:hypothetical protein